MILRRIGQPGVGEDNNEAKKAAAQFGARPFFLKNDLDEGKLKKELRDCKVGQFKKTTFSIGHRGAALQFPEHTRESYQAAAKMGAGIIECDVTFSKDRTLVSPLAMRFAHHHQYSGNAVGGKMLARIYAGAN